MRKKVFIAIGLIFVAGLIIIVSRTSKLYPILFQVLFNKDVQLKKENSNINILLLGTGGGQHEGPDLTDTIIFVSVDPNKNKVTLVSIPRDLWIADLNARINTAYSNAEAKRKGAGILVASTVVKKVVNHTIDYTVRIDFDGFIQVIDILGGVDIDVQSAFDDYKYPITEKESDSCGYSDEDIKMFTATRSAEIDVQEKFICRYKHLHFDKGVTHMDGQTALEFVRSRHAQGSDGTDFSRSKRQEQVIKSARDKVFSISFFLNPTKVISVYDALRNSIDTNIKDEEIDDFIRLFQKMQNAKIESAVLDYGDEKRSVPGLLINPALSTDYDGQWVLIPRIGNNKFEEIQKYVDCEIKVGNCPIKATAQ